MLTKSLSCEWADKGIRVNAMCLGYMRTEISEDRYQRKMIEIWYSHSLVLIHLQQKKV